MFPLAFVAGWYQGHWWGFISRNYVVWPIFLLMNVFIALKGSHFWFLFELQKFTQYLCGAGRFSSVWGFDMPGTAYDTQVTLILSRCLTQATAMTTILETVQHSECGINLCTKTSKKSTCIAESKARIRTMEITFIFISQCIWCHTRFPGIKRLHLWQFSFIVASAENNLYFIIKHCLEEAFHFATIWRSE